MKKYLFLSLAIGFTGISLVNGFEFYLSLLGFEMAIMISIVVEVSRLASLFSIRNGNGVNPVALTIFIATAALCSFASIANFSSDIIQRGIAADAEINSIAHNIRGAYVEKLNQEIKQVESNINKTERDIDYYKGEKRKYFERRKITYVTKRDKLLQKRDKFLSQSVTTNHEWITKYSALTGASYKNVTKGDTKITAITKALKEVFGLERTQAERIIGIAITFVIELSIFLLAYVATWGMVARDKKVTASKTEKTEAKKNHVRDSLLKKYSKNQIDSALLIIEEHLRIGKKIKLSEISPSLRPVVKDVRLAEGLKNEKKNTLA